MSSAASSKVSFTVRRPTPASRAGSSGPESDVPFKIPALPRRLTNGNGGSPLARSAAASPQRSSRRYAERDSSDEDEELQDELVTGFDAFGVQRLHEKKRSPQGPLVIPALQNKDWRELARKRKSLYVPPSGAAETGADGSVGGLGTRDAINSGPEVVGLQMRKRVKVEQQETLVVVADEPMPAPEDVKKEETEDQRALRAVLAGAQADGMGLDGPAIDIIPAPSEDEAYRQDVEELPDEATLEDYERIPVSQFGAALLRGMGWKEGMSASKKNKGLIEPWLPQARPALLGIGAKEKEVLDDGSKKKGGKGRPERRYVPVMKVEKRADGEQRREGSSSGTSSSRRRSPSPERHSSRRHSRSPPPDRRRERDRRDDYDRDKRRDYDSSRNDRDRDRDRRRDRSADRHQWDRRRKDKDRRDD
ncbi:DExH-box splicing factor binding site-domain-containing protein [Amylocystis lapponica]|nr:DExH-box splicing factor binding site-domain-containing protein [Amylocystis lapponica]